MKKISILEDVYYDLLRKNARLTKDSSALYPYDPVSYFEDSSEDIFLEAFKEAIESLKKKVNANVK